MNDKEIIEKFGMVPNFNALFNPMDVGKNDQHRWNDSQRYLFRRLVVAAHNAGYDWYGAIEQGQQLRIGFRNLGRRKARSVAARLHLNSDQNFYLGNEKLATLNEDHIKWFLEKIKFDKECLPRKPKREGFYPLNYQNNQPTEIESATSMNLNTIYFGPPGTGKTYHSTAKSLQLLGIQDDPGNTHQEFSKACKEGNIVFTTFHQSYSYEDFVEGIRVNTNEREEVEYKIRNGMFKRLARKALFHKAAQALGKALDDETDQMANAYSEILDENITAKDKIIEKLEGAKQILQKIEQWKSNPLDATVSNADERVEKERVFVLVVDEINRGNISKIFGELITLIEDNKRLGKQDMLSVTLPYSGEQFFVPDNLYIVGTMNTADRSLAALDVALRRRFVFEEMMPNFAKAGPLSEVKVPGVEVCDWMSKVNQRIQAERGREFTIGHAFFMPLTVKPTMDELASIMKLKILPLLEEYFFDDWEGIRYVLGEKDEFSPDDCLVKVTSVQSRNTKEIKIYGWNEAALIKPASYR